MVLNTGGWGHRSGFNECYRADYNWRLVVARRLDHGSQVLVATDRTGETLAV